LNIDTISIKEYAILCNISKQAVYKRLNTSLQPFCIKVFNPTGRDEIRLKWEVLTEEQQKKYKLLFREKTTIVSDSTSTKNAENGNVKRHNKSTKEVNAEVVELCKAQLAQKAEENTYLRGRIEEQEQTMTTLKDIILAQKTQHEQSQAFISQQQETIMQQQSIIAEQQKTIAQLAQRSTETAQEATPDEVPIENKSEAENRSEGLKNGFISKIKKWWSEL